jgi:hypothetical protein
VDDAVGCSFGEVLCSFCGSLARSAPLVRGLQFFLYLGSVLPRVTPYGVDRLDPSLRCVDPLVPVLWDAGMAPDYNVTLDLLRKCTC